MKLEEAVNAVIEAAGRHRGMDASSGLPEALSAMEQFGDERERFMAEVAKGLPDITSPMGAGIVAIWLGATVEHGGNPKAGGEAVIETLLKWCGKLPEPSDDEDADLPDVHEDVVKGMEMMGQSSVAHLSRDAALLEKLKGDADAFEALSHGEHWSNGPMWVLQILNQRSGDLLVLHGVEEKGFRVRYENLANCFQLFTLLQGALGDRMPGGREPDEEVIAMALGEEGDCEGDTAWWHYGQGNVPEPNIMASVFGEASPDSISVVDGEKVMLLWPPVLQSRGWGHAFFTPILDAARPKVTVIEELSAAEITKWRERLKLKAGAEEPKKPWWKLFG